MAIDHKISQRMLTTASHAQRLISPESWNAIIAFCGKQWQITGGFKGRVEISDLYYTLFGMDCFKALGLELPVEPLFRYLSTFGDGAALDFVHLNCLARCLAHLPAAYQDERLIKLIFQNIEKYRSHSGGYLMTTAAQHDSIYAAFLARLTYENFQRKMNRPEALIAGVQQLRSLDGAFAGQRNTNCGTTTVTAAAMLLQHQFQHTIDSTVSQWLLSRQQANGGFVATPNAPVPDLLSTATALFALKSVGLLRTEMKDQAFHFIAELWQDNGGFVGNFFDTVPDCEYTYYGLLALGCLAGDEA